MVKYTQDYTTNASQDMIEVFPKLLEKREHPINFLEIGCFEGRTSRWIVENMFNHPEDKLYCVDPWWQHSIKTMGDGRYDLFIDNIEDIKDRIQVIRGLSQHVLPTFKDEFFDGIYVDGSHEAIDVMSDAIHSLRLIKSGHIILFDDYGWNGGRHQMPKMAIDSFVEMTDGWITEVVFKRYRLAVKKKG